MSASDKVFAGSIPKMYDDCMVPLIFAGFAEDLAHKAATFSPATVLETAAGTGVLTRALAPKLAANARYVVTDLNQPMLDYAAQRQGQDRRITWHQADALALPFPDAHFDVVCCQFGAMFFPDRTKGKPSGSLSPAEVSSSTSGTGSKTTCSRMTSRSPSPNYFQTIRRVSWRGRRTVTTTRG